MTTPVGILLDSIVLKNGLEVFFYDQSKPVAGDRLMVQLLIDLPIAIDSGFSHERPDAGEAFHDFHAHFGGVIHYQIVKTRNFVSENEGDSMLSQLRQEFMDTQFHYVQHSGFAHNFILKTYEEWHKKHQYSLAHAAAVRQAESDNP
jgi:hypothetical protein